MVKFFANEPKTAAYLGYHTIGAYRRFRFHPLCLQHYAYFKPYCAGRPAKNAFFLLNSITDVSEYGEDVEDLITKYPLVEELIKEDKTLNNERQDIIFAGILYHMAEALKVPPTFSHEETETIRAEFAKFLPPKAEIPEIDYDTINFPEMGPLEFETSMEVYNRVYCILKSIECVVAGSRWKETFERASNPFPETMISEDAKPVWMKVNAAKPQVTFNPFINLHTQMERPRMSKKYLAKLHREEKTKRNDELIAHEATLNYEGLGLFEEHALSKDLRD